MLALLTATIILLAARIEGKAKDSQGPAAPAVVEMQGAAIISNEPLQQLVRAIEADNVEGIQLQMAVVDLTEAIGDQTEELMEIRRETALKR